MGSFRGLETGKIYVTTDNNRTYRYSGSSVIEVNSAVNTADLANKATAINDFRDANTAVSRPIWISSNDVMARPAHTSNFQYDPSAKKMTIGSGTLTETNYSGKAATAGTADRANTGNWQPKTDNRWYMAAYALDSQFNFDNSNSYQYNPSIKTLKVNKEQLKATGGNWVSGMTLANAAVQFPDTFKRDGSAYYPILGGKDTSGNIWNLGWGAEGNIGFYGYKAGRTANGFDGRLIFDPVTGKTTGDFVGNVQGTATKATQDSDGNAINSTYLKRSGGTMTGAFNFANNTANVVGDDVKMGDFNQAGTLAIQGANGQTAVALKAKSAAWNTAANQVKMQYNESTKSLDFIFS